MKKTWLRIPALFLCLVMLSGIAVAQEPQGVIDLEKIKSEYKYGDVLTFDTYGQLTEENRAVEGKYGVVSSQRYEASRIGADIIAKGGNAVDAAVAAAFALGVCEPNASGMGGGGFMTYRNGETGEIIFIDFREVAPGAATEDMYPQDENGNVIGNIMARGGKAVAVPGEVAGLMYILDNYGTMSRQEVLQPAIDLANEGYLVTAKTNTTITDAYQLMTDYPELGKIFLGEDGLPPEAGTYIKNPDLAKTLGIIAEKGAAGFYEGEVAQALVDAAAKYGGIITLEDLKNYQITVKEPVEGTYRGYKIYSAPPPSSGGTHLIQILNILENFDVGSLKFYGAEHMHLLSEAFKMVYLDRSTYMGDPDYVKVPLKGLVDKEYAKLLAEKIEDDKSKSYEVEDPWLYEGTDTSHLSVSDKAGNMIGITKTINYYYGSGVAVDGYGFILNNEMDDFSSKPGGPNSVQPGKKPLSSMSPTIVLREDGSPYMVLGAPGGYTIFAQVAQVISDVIDFQLPLKDAIKAPRIFNWVDNTLEYQDGFGIPIEKAEVDKLTAIGHDMSHYMDGAFGFIQGTLYNEDGTIDGGADYYADGVAVGY